MYRNKYIPCWDAECEYLYRTFLQFPQGNDSSLAVTALLAKLNRKRKDQWSVAVQSIAPGPDSVFPELIIHAGAALNCWLLDFLTSCLRQLKIPKICRRALVVAIAKPMKPVGDPKSHQPISLLCVRYKILERLIYTRVEALIDPLLPKEQDGF